MEPKTGIMTLLKVGVSLSVLSILPVALCSTRAFCLMEQKGSTVVQKIYVVNEGLSLVAYSSVYTSGVATKESPTGFCSHGESGISEGGSVRHIAPGEAAEVTEVTLQKGDTAMHELSLEGGESMKIIPYWREMPSAPKKEARSVRVTSLWTRLSSKLWH